MPVSSNQQNRVADILRKDAILSGNAREYFDKLILASTLPEEVKLERVGALKDDPETNAVKLVYWALNYGTNPEDGRSALASVVLPRVGRLGVENAAYLASVIVANKLVPDAERDGLRRRFQMPVSLKQEVPPGTAIGPGFAWVGPDEEVKLENWLFPAEPEYLEVSLLLHAVERARSVCRVEVAARGESGTGVLIADDLVLTNYHVLTRKPDDLLMNAKSALLRFGAFTSSKEAGDGQVVKLAAQPVLEASPVDEYDFVLLKTDGTKAKDIVPTAPSASTSPAPNSAMHLLQHPRGGPMMLTLNKNGVTRVNADTGKIQYVTRSAGGSSGAPCFDENWNLVAIHHAEIAKSFGSVREGILIKPILERVKKHLG